MYVAVVTNTFCYVEIRGQLFPWEGVQQSIVERTFCLLIFSKLIPFHFCEYQNNKTRNPKKFAVSQFKTVSCPSI